MDKRIHTAVAVIAATIIAAAHVSPARAAGCGGGSRWEMGVSGLSYHWSDQVRRRTHWFNPGLFITHPIDGVWLLGAGKYQNSVGHPSWPVGVERRWMLLDHPAVSAGLLAGALTGYSYYTGLAVTPMFAPTVEVGHDALDSVQRRSDQLCAGRSACGAGD